MRFSQLTRTDPKLLGLVVFAAALVVRVVYLVDIRANPFFRTPVIDAEFYHQMAAALVGQGIGRVPFQMPPGYPLLLSLVYRLFGVSLVAAHVLQILLGAGVAALTFAIGRRLAGTGVGLVAAAFVATSKALLFLEGDVLATPLGICLDLLSLLCLVRWAQDGERRRDLVGAGLTLGGAAITVPLLLAVLPAFLGWLGWRRRRPAAAVAFALLVAAPILPVTLRNWRASGELVPVSANGGINFWMGNNPDMRRTVTLRPGPEWRVMQELPLRDAGLVASSARDRWFLRQGLRFWFEHPLRALLQTGEKALLLGHDHETMRDFDYYYFRDHFSRVLRLPGWSFGLLLSLSVVGMLWARSRAAGEGVLLLFLASYALGIVLFFVTARYRAPLLPVLAVFASQGLVWIVARVRAREFSRLVRPLAALVVIGLVSWIDFLGVDRVEAADAEYRVATTFEKSGRLQDALQRYDGVLRLDPDHALAAARGAVCSQLLGRTQEAVGRYEALLERHPEYAEAAVNLATLAWQNGNRTVAEHYFQQALAADPYLAQAHASYGLYRLQGGDARGAVESLTEALRYDPTWEAIRVDYARALLAAGDAAGAWREIARVEKSMPPSDRLELVRGDAYQAEGRSAEARAAWNRGLQLNPANPELRARLATSPGR